MALIENQKKRNRVNRPIQKEEVIRYYSNDTMKCANCPANDMRVLSIDHIEGNGSTRRGVEGSGSELYRWLARNNYPEGYQVLCMNCQFIKRSERGETRR